MFIENISMDHCRTGYHYDAGVNSMLIQIVDPGHEFPTPFYHFKEVHQFEFLDIDDGDPDWETLEEFAITEDQAKKIYSLLKHAYRNRMNVIVHCHAGLCRSGAVAEIGIVLGFQDTETIRIPNIRVKQLLLEQLDKDFQQGVCYEFQ